MERKGQDDTSSKKKDTKPSSTDLPGKIPPDKVDLSRCDKFENDPNDVKTLNEWLSKHLSKDEYIDLTRFKLKSPLPKLFVTSEIKDKARILKSNSKTSDGGAVAVAMFGYCVETCPICLRRYDSPKCTHPTFEDTYEHTEVLRGSNDLTEVLMCTINDKVCYPCNMICAIAQKVYETGHDYEYFERKCFEFIKLHKNAAARQNNDMKTPETTSLGEMFLLKCIIDCNTWFQWSERYQYYIVRASIAEKLKKELFDIVKEHWTEKPHTVIPIDVEHRHLGDQSTQPRSGDIICFTHAHLNSSNAQLILTANEFTDTEMTGITSRAWNRVTATPMNVIMSRPRHEKPKSDMSKYHFDQIGNQIALMSTEYKDGNHWCKCGFKSTEFSTFKRHDCKTLITPKAAKKKEVGAKETLCKHCNTVHNQKDHTSCKIKNLAQQGKFICCDYKYKGYSGYNKHRDLLHGGTGKKNTDGEDIDALAWQFKRDQGIPEDKIDTSNRVDKRKREKKTKSKNKVKIPKKDSMDSLDELQ